MVYIKDKRLQLNMSQQKLAEVLSVKQNTIANWENGKRTPDIEMVVKLSEIFNCSVDEIVKPDLSNSICQNTA